MSTKQTPKIAADIRNGTIIGVALTLVMQLLRLSCMTASAEERGVLWMVKPNASLTCEEPSTLSLQDGAEELRGRGVEVLGTDFSAAQQLVDSGCDKPSFIYDSYLIRKKDSAQAEALGFEHAPNGLNRPYKVVGH